MSRYQRQFPRPGYEAELVEALATVGYQVVLSTDFEDEIVGVDAWDVEYGIPIDFTLTKRSLEIRAVCKARKNHEGRVAVLGISQQLVDDLGVVSKRTRVYLELEQVYSDFLDDDSTQFSIYVTRQETQDRERVWVNPSRRKNA